jgi:type VI secretion system ImpA family protein
MIDQDLEQFLNTIPGENGATGLFLKYLPEYDIIRSIRKQDEEFFPASLKEGNNYNREWVKLCAICQDIIINKSKDFQIAIWFMEGLFYCQGINGLIKGLELLNLLIDKFWDMGHPPLEEDLEYRLAPFVWINEKFCDKFIFVKLTASNFIDDNPYSYADWLDMKRTEMLIQKSKNPSAAKDRAAKEGKVTPDSFEKAFSRTSIDFFIENLEKIKIIQSSLQAIDDKIEALTKGKGVSFVRFKKALEDIIFIFKNRIPPEPEPAEILVEEPISLDSSMGEDQKDQNPNLEIENPPTSIIVPANQNLGYSRDSAYVELEKIAKFLETLEPHSPAPYLIRRSIQWGGMNLAELYEDLLINEGNLAQVMRLLGLGTKEIPLANPPKKR